MAQDGIFQSLGVTHLQAMHLADGVGQLSFQVREDSVCVCVFVCDALSLFHKIMLVPQASQVS